MTAIKSQNRLFSIVIPTWNNLAFLKLCIQSIQRNSYYNHQIIVHVNDGSDGTLEWIKKAGIDYTHSEQNIGVCFAMNMMRTKVKTDYILFLNDDMYVLPFWDKVLYDEIEKLSDNYFFLSATSIQPHTQSASTILANYGDSIETFQEDKLLKEYMNYKINDWMGATIPPNIVHRDIWDLVGGYSIEYSPGMYSDPDFTAKLYMCGVRFMKGLQASRIYHFETKSTTRIRKNCGQMQFLLKWGMTSSTFRKVFTYKGKDFSASTILANYGDSIETFQEDKLLKEYMNYKINDWMGATIPPNIVHRDIWDLVGGYSIEYSPGMYSDPDFTAKLYMCGVRFMKGLQASRIYHFETKSTTRIRKNCGQMQFLLKWGMTSSTFRKVFTYKGKDFKSQKIGTFKTGNRFKISLIRGRLKAIFYLLTKDFGPLWKFWKKTFV